MIDTGASLTCFDLTAARELGLPIVGKVTITSASHIDHPTPQFAGRLILPNLGINVERGVGVELASQGLIALVGRDVLRHCTFFYNGPDGSVSCAI